MCCNRTHRILAAGLLLLFSCGKKSNQTTVPPDQDTTQQEPCAKNNTGTVRIISQQPWKFEITLNSQPFGIQPAQTTIHWTIPCGVYTIRLEQMEGYIMNPIVISNQYTIQQCDTVQISY